ncbi:MAG: hypothetical protein Q9200_001424 [Gallowayella weberi]
MSFGQVNPLNFGARNLTELHHAHTRLNLTYDASERTDLWQVRHVVGAGQGCIALNYIPRGTLLLKEAPLFVIEEVEDGPLSPNTKTQINHAVAELGSNQFRSFKALIDPTPGRANDYGRFQINNFQMTSHPTQNTFQQGIFLRAARFNHSCVPNAHFTWNPVLGCLTVFATQGIHGGNEILINYQYEDAYKSRAERRRNLRQSYNFECNCVACMDGPNLNSNEQRRQEFRHLDGRIQAGTNDRPNQHQNIQRLLGLLVEAGITYPQNAELYGQLAESWKELLHQTNTWETSYRAQCRQAAADAAWSKLEAEIVAVSDDSPEVRETLALIGSLRP